MATTFWIAGSGDWNTASNWSNGVPTAADDAVIGGDGAGAAGTFTITGGGAAASLDIRLDGVAFRPTLTGSHAVGTFLDDHVDVTLSPTAVLSFGAGTLTDGAELALDAGASIGTGPLALRNADLGGLAGTLANPITLLALGMIDLTGVDGTSPATLSGQVSGPGPLRLDGNVILADGANSFSGGLDADGPRLELAAADAGGVPGPMQLGGTLVLDPGAVVGPITVGASEIDATDQANTVYVRSTGLLYESGAGHANIVGPIDPNATFEGEYGPPVFGSFTVHGGTGSVTVFGGNDSGAFYGGSAGGNVLIAGPDLPGPQPSHSYTDPEGRSSALAAQPGPVTLVGGGSGDILVATGTDNLTGSNLLVAGAGNETLTGSGSTAGNVFFGGSGADVIAAGSGPGVVVAGSGPATISGGAGGTAIFAGPGQDVILGGAGAGYVQVGAGNATLFAGAGMDLVGAVNGAGGSLAVSGFKVGTDRISAQGYAAAPTVTGAGGSTVLGFSDGTRVTLLGVASLPSSAYS